MKAKSLFLLYGIAAVLAIAVFITKKVGNAGSAFTAQYERGAQPLMPLPADKLARIELTDGNQTTTLQLSDGSWTLAERNGYAVDFAQLQTLLAELNELKVTQSLEAGATYDARFGIGTSITLKDAAGKVLRTLRVGKQISTNEQTQMASLTGGSSASGRYLRLPEDENVVYITNSPLSPLTVAPAAWLRPDFIQVEEIVAVSLSAPGKLDTIVWKATRPDASGTFTLQGGVPEGKEYNTTALSSLGGLFTQAKFEDVVSPFAAEGLIDPTRTQRAVLQTADGITYQIDIAPKDAKGTKNYLLTVQVSANFPTELPTVEGEDADDEAQKAFAEALKQKQDKLAQQQALAGHYYEVSPYIVQNLLKAKSELIQDKTE